MSAGQLQLSRAEVALLLKSLMREMRRVNRRVERSKTQAAQKEGIALVTLTEKVIAFEKELSRTDFKLKVRRT